MKEEELRQDILRYAHLVYSKGWVANHDGNLSCRLEDNKFLCTPTAISKGDVNSSMLIVVDDNSKVIQGTRRAFSEFRFHKAAYAARPDIGCVIHAHPPTATGFCVANIPLGEPFMAEPVVSLGGQIPLLPFRLPNAEDIFELFAEALSSSDVLMLSNHGVLVVGGSFEQAFLRLELIEHLSKISLVARQLGGAKLIPAEVVQTLLKKGRPASNPSFGDAPSSTSKETISVKTERDVNIQRLVSDALKKYK